MIAVFVFFAVIAGDAFISLAGFSSWLNVAAEVGVVALPVGLLMIAGELDLSIGAAQSSPPRRDAWQSPRVIAAHQRRLG